MKTIFFDIDGTLARFHDVDHNYVESMWQEGFYKNLKPFENIVVAADYLSKQGRKHDVKVAVISAYLETDPPFVQKEKMEWLHKYLPHISDIRLVPAGTDKSNYIHNDENEAWLVDDYNKNLIEWENQGFHSIKFVNDVNDRGKGSYGGEVGKLWSGKRIYFDSTPMEIVQNLSDIMNLNIDFEIYEENHSQKQITKNKKFALTDETMIDKDGVILHRIIALKDFADVRKGDIGGFVESEKNLLHFGNCWIYDNAVVKGGALVADNAAIKNNAVIEDNAFVCGNSEVFDNAIVCNDALVSDNAVVQGSALVGGYSVVNGCAAIIDFAKIVECASVTDQAVVKDNAVVCNKVNVEDRVIVSGNVKLKGALRYDGQQFIDETIRNKLQSITDKSNLKNNFQKGRNEFERY